MTENQEFYCATLVKWTAIMDIGDRASWWEVHGSTGALEYVAQWDPGHEVVVRRVTVCESIDPWADYQLFVRRPQGEEVHLGGVTRALLGAVVDSADRRRTLFTEFFTARLKHWREARGLKPGV